MSSMINTLTRRRGLHVSQLDPAAASGPKFSKTLSTFDLTALGIGCTLGVGVYVLVGEGSRDYAGPAVVLSFTIAAIASLMAGLCYAEFGARVPRAGSAYVYTYVMIGEFLAFLIGWNLILEYAIGVASVAKAFTNILDAMCENVISKFLLGLVPMHNSQLSEYVDFFAFGLTIIFTLVLAFGAKESVRMNNVFMVVCLIVISYVIVVCGWHANPANWSLPVSAIPAGFGSGGFAPFGMAGVLRAAAFCFYGFIGFDVIATAGEETRNPRRSVPIAVCSTLLVMFALYFTLSIVLTMAVPYYAQDAKAPILTLFKIHGLTTSRWIVSVGTFLGMCSCMLTSIFPIPRIIYAMAVDGLLFGWLGKISARFRTPMWATLLSGFLTAVIAAVFNLSELINMMSIGTLLAYTIVGACVLLLRYKVLDLEQKELDGKPTAGAEPAMGGTMCCVGWLVNKTGTRTVTPESQLVVTWLVTAHCIWCALWAATVKFLGTDVLAGVWWACVLFALLSVLLLTTVACIARQPGTPPGDTFRVPCSPYLPAASILTNVYLMVELDVHTWVRFVVWIALGLLLYFGYGVRHSVVGRTRKAVAAAAAAAAVAAAAATTVTATPTPTTTVAKKDEAEADR